MSAPNDNFLEFGWDMDEEEKRMLIKEITDSFLN
jgi:hypothetical protein